ncbi:MAG: hypothetical protein ACLQDY_21980, partial [Streptosporangiaceae bacterium]
MRPPSRPAADGSPPQPRSRGPGSSRGGGPRAGPGAAARGLVIVAKPGGGAAHDGVARIRRRAGTP